MENSIIFTPCEIGPITLRNRVIRSAAFENIYKLKPSLMRLGIRIGVIGTPQWLVRKAINGMMCKRRVVKPGFMNRYLPPLIAILPKSIVNSIWKKFK